jgi:hypothetical protein
MQTIKYVYWQEDDAWLGYLQDYPDYWTQGERRRWPTSSTTSRISTRT